jgi:hypothetical protein
LYGVKKLLGKKVSQRLIRVTTLYAMLYKAPRKNNTIKLTPQGCN